MITVPCGSCIGCRLDRSRAWAIRCVHEAQLHETNCFITLTYDEKHLPKDGSLSLGDFQLFMKRLRKSLSPKQIRFFHCGEYGDKLSRPHYHACIFNHDFADRTLWSQRNGNKLYRSASLEKLWPYGYSSVGTLTWQSAAYIARYITKKITGAAAKDHYERVETSTGEITHLAPEYITMSLKPGIGSEWFKLYSGDVYPGDFVVIDGKKFKPPRYYDNLLELSDLETFELIKEERENYALKYPEEQSPSRLATREICTLKKTESLLRPLEEQNL